MARVITNTFTLTVVPDVEATRPNLVHCSAFNKDRMGWWSEPSNIDSQSYGVTTGIYGINGFNAYELFAKPGKIISLSQRLSLTDPSSEDVENSALMKGTWYTISFRCSGVHRHINSDGSVTDIGKTKLYVYIYPSVIDTTAKIIVDGVETNPPGDMATPISVGWNIEQHTISFKTLESIGDMPRILFRSFGEGTTAYDSTTFANGGCLVRISCIKIEEGITATAYTPHATELLPPVHAVAFKRDNTDISGTAPTGGTYTSPTPADWSDGIPSGEQRLWETKAVFVPELPSATWSKPSPVGDTSDSDVEFSPYSGTPTSHVSENLAAAGTAATSTTNLWFDPARNSDADFSKMIWRAERQKKNGTWSDWTIIKVKGETGEPGKDAVLLDLDNEMDSIAVDSSGTVTTEQSVTTNVTIFKGATAQFITGDAVAADSLNGITASKTSINGKVSVTFTFPAGTTFADQHYTAVIGVTFGGATYTATFTLAPVRLGKDACLYKVLPSMSSCPFTRNEDNTLSPVQYTLKCGYVAVKGDTSTTVENYGGIFGGSYRIFLRSKINKWNKWRMYGDEEDTEDSATESSLTVSTSIFLPEAIEFCIAKATSEAEFDKSLIVDREVVPVVVGGANGADGENAFIVDLDNEMDAIPCDSTGRLSSQRTYNLNLGAFYGTQETALTSVVATIKDCNENTLSSGISVSTTNKKAPVVSVSAGTYNASPYTISLECTSDYGTRTVVFTLVTQKAGAPGVTPTIYQLAPSHTSLSYTRNDDGSLTGSNTLTCKMKQTTGSSTSETDVSSSSTYYIYYGFNDAASPSTRLPSGGLTVSSSVAESNKNVVLELWKGERTLTTSVRLDRETIPILKDGSKGLPGDPGNPGDKGDDATIAWLSCPYVAIPCYNTGKPKIASFTVEAKKRIGDGTPTEARSPYKIEAAITYGDETTSTSDSTTGSLSVGLNQSKVLTSVVINLKYNTTIQTITLNPILDGAMGSAGEKYLPIVLGIYDSTTTYQWTNGVRHGCYYAIDGKYYIFYVRNNGTNSTLPAPTGEDDPNWEQAYRLYTIFTDAIYTTNANVGGFLASDKMLVSSEAAYNMTYRGYPPYKYRGSYSSSKTYSSDDIVLLSGTYYLYTGSSSRVALKSDTAFGSYLINMVTGLSSDTDTTVYGYYDPTNRTDRPFVYFNKKFYTPKANASGRLTTSPTAANTQWRELFPAEKYMLGITSSSDSTSFPHSEANIYTRSVSKYVLNGKQGTTTMLQVDDTVWEYDEGGNQTLGIPYGKHIEISPAGGKVMFFGSDGTQNGEMSGEAVETIAELVGENSVSPTGSLSQKNVYGDGNSGRRQQYEDTVVSSFQLTNSGSLTVNSNITIGGDQWETSLAGGGGSSNTGPLLDGTMILGSSNRRYTNTMSSVLVVQNLSNGSWQDVGAASLQRSTTEMIRVATFQSSSRVVVSAGTYRVIARYTASVYANKSYKAWVSVNSCKVTVVSLINLHRFFGNGFAFGSASNNFFAAVNESGSNGKNMHIKALTNVGKYGFELDKNEGLLATRNSFQGKVPMLVYYGFITDDGSALSQAKKYSFDDKTLTCARMGDGDYQLTIPSTWSNGGMSFDGGNLIPTIICNTTTTGVSAQVYTLGSNYIRVVTANDKTVDKSNLIVKLEYIG